MSHFGYPWLLRAFALARHMYDIRFLFFWASFSALASAGPESHQFSHK
jgi:hypothetical protein